MKKVHCTLFHDPVEITFALVAVASQENCDGPEYDLMMEAADLVKPCPFCGLQMQDSDADDYLHPMRVKSSRFWERWSINCLEIAGGCGVQMLGDTEEDVISKWNRRRFEIEPLYTLQAHT